MTYSLAWLADVLRDAGLKGLYQAGCMRRALGEMKAGGVLCHLSAGPAKGNAPCLDLIVKGRPDLTGPLAQLCLGRDGTYYVVAAGKANPAGAGAWKGVKTGNTSFVGIEAENCGTKADPWPEVQMDAYRRGVAAILNHLGQGADMCCGHKEYALPKGRKSVPNFVLDAFRASLAPFLAAGAEKPARPSALRPTLGRGEEGMAVVTLQAALGIDADGVFGAGTEAAVRAFQAAAGLGADGVVGLWSLAALCVLVWSSVSARSLCF